MRFDAVFWDVDSTLLDPRIPERNAIRKCFEIFGFGVCSDEMLDRYPSINISWWDRMQTEGKTKEEITVGRFTDFLAYCNKDNSRAAEFNRAYMVRLGDTICPTPHAIETIKALRGKVKQYIVTNGLIFSQSKKLSNSGLDKLVDDFFISEAVGFDKPDKRFFDFVFDKTGLKDKSRILIVGDSISNDMQGGNNAQIICCWYNPDHKKNDGNVRIDYEIDDIASVLKLVE